MSSDYYGSIAGDLADEGETHPGVDGLALDGADPPHMGTMADCTYPECMEYKEADLCADGQDVTSEAGCPFRGEPGEGG